MHDFIAFPLYMLALAIFGYSMFSLVIPAIDVWELANGYPYGMACDIWNQCNK